MGKSRKVSSISKEFDGKEVQGKLIERSGLFGSNVSKEVFKMPGGGKHIEKTRTNKKGDIVSRSTKDTKVNPLVFFNKNKEQAYKKAGGEIAAFKKSLKRMDNGGGSGMGRMAANDTAYDSMMNQTSEPEIDLNLELGNRYKNMAPVVGKLPGVREGFTREQMSRLNATPIKNKKGGSVNRKNR